MENTPIGTCVVFLSLTGNSRRFAEFAAKVVDAEVVSFWEVKKDLFCKNLLIVSGVYLLSNLWWLPKLSKLKCENLATCSLFSIAKNVAQRAESLFKTFVDHKNYYGHYIEVGYFPLFYWTKSKPYPQDYSRFKLWLENFKLFCERQNRISQ